MAASRQRRNIVYGFNQPLSSISPEPITSNRAPTTLDRAEIGTPWVNGSTNAAWILASVVANSSTWTPTTVNAGATITTGNLTVTAGNVVVTAGNITAAAGDITATAAAVVAGTDVTAGRSVFVAGDEGTGEVANLGLTNVTDETQNVGALTLVSTTAGSGTNTGFMKMYNGLQPVWVPYFETINP